MSEQQRVARLESQMERVEFMLREVTSALKALNDKSNMSAMALAVSNPRLFFLVTGKRVGTWAEENQPQ